MRLGCHGVISFITIDEQIQFNRGCCVLNTSFGWWGLHICMRFIKQFKYNTIPDRKLTSKWWRTRFIDVRFKVFNCSSVAFIHNYVVFVLENNWVWLQYCNKKIRYILCTTLYFYSTTNHFDSVSAYKIHISNFTYEELIKCDNYVLEKRGTIPVKVFYHKIIRLKLKYNLASLWIIYVRYFAMHLKW